MTGNPLRHCLILFLGFLSAFSFFAFAYAADTPPVGGTGCASGNFIDALVKSESGTNPAMTNCTVAPNGKDYCGKYQFSPELRAKFGLDYTSSVAAQDAAFSQYLAANQNQLQQRGAFNYVGQSFTVGGTSVPITQNGILAVSHLGGVGGVNRFLSSGGAYNPADGKDSRANSGNSAQCAALRDAGVGVRERNRTASTLTGKPLQCGTYLSDYMTKFSSTDDPSNPNAATNCATAPVPVATANPLCADKYRNMSTALNNAALAQKFDTFKNVRGPLVTPSQSINTPCKSRELQRISNQFASAPSRYGSDALGQLSGLMGPVSGLMNNFLKADTQALMSFAKNGGGTAASAFYSFTQGQLSNLMGSLGLGDSPFASALCGLMVDALLNYAQCESPFKLPDLGKLTGSLNKFLPKGCAGEAIRGALYRSASEQAFRPTGQGVVVGTSALFTPSKSNTVGPWQTTVTRPWQTTVTKP